ncbi:MAG: aminotransferase class I/II-fold pyridoxal phosphate-dependent enzyme [Myxococcota bacterium]
MNVPFVDIGEQNRALHPTLLAAIDGVLRSGRYVLGPQTAQLEASMADRIGVSAAVAVSSGTDALIAALMSLDIGPGDLVITTPYSFVASATALYRVGARPVFVDIEADTFNLDPRAVEAWFEAAGAHANRVKAIVAVHLYGQCANLVALSRIAAARQIALVEDLAQALDAEAIDLNQSAHQTPTIFKAGSVGDAACLSFYPTQKSLRFG